MNGARTDVRINSDQVHAALSAYVNSKARRSAKTKRAATPEQEAADMTRRLNDSTKNRDVLVHDLRTKVRHGRYFVSSERIVEALLERADQTDDDRSKG